MPTSCCQGLGSASICADPDPGFGKKMQCCVNKNESNNLFTNIPKIVNNLKTVIVKVVLHMKKDFLDLIFKSSLKFYI